MSFLGYMAIYIYHCFLGGGFKYLLCSPPFGEDFQFDWLVQPPTTRMSQEVRKRLVNGLFHLLLTGLYWGYNPFTNHLIGYA